MKNSAKLRLVGKMVEADPASAVTIIDLHVWFDETHVLRGVNLELHKGRINCIIGPSGGGKSTLIRSLNRMHDDVAGYNSSGSILFDGEVVQGKSTNVAKLRTDIGMVFQKPCVFPRSIAENVLFGVQHLRRLSRQEKQNIVEMNLKAVSLWKEVSHRLNDRAGSLSIGQQQRLCIARTLAVKPRVILLDEPTSSLDPVSTRAIESLMLDLKQDYTIVFVTHNIQQAQRVADQLIFMCNGEIIEQGAKQKLFSNPEKEQTRNYLNEEYCDC